MRLRACPGMIALTLLAGCETLPEKIVVGVDGRVLEIKRKAAAAEPADAERR